MREERETRKRGREGNLPPNAFDCGFWVESGVGRANGRCHVKRSNRGVRLLGIDILAVISDFFTDRFQCCMYGCVVAGG
jgi:hypothetical protein